MFADLVIRSESSKLCVVFENKCNGAAFTRLQGLELSKPDGGAYGTWASRDGFTSAVAVINNRCWRQDFDRPSPVLQCTSDDIADAADAQSRESDGFEREFFKHLATFLRRFSSVFSGFSAPEDPIVLVTEFSTFVAELALQMGWRPAHQWRGMLETDSGDEYHGVRQRIQSKEGAQLDMWLTSYTSPKASRTLEVWKPDADYERGDSICKRPLPDLINEFSAEHDSERIRSGLRSLADELLAKLKADTRPTPTTRPGGRRGA